MNSKLVIISVMMLSLLTITATGQKLKSIQQVILQDDKSGDHLVFNVSTGEYKFESCDRNFATGGVGRVSVNGCRVSLRQISDTARVLAEVDLCAKTGKADIAFTFDAFNGQQDLTEFETVIGDSNIRDSVFNCVFKTIEPK